MVMAHGPPLRLQRGRLIRVGRGWARDPFCLMVVWFFFHLPGTAVCLFFLCHLCRALTPHCPHRERNWPRTLKEERLVLGFPRTNIALHHHLLVLPKSLGFTPACLRVPWVACVLPLLQKVVEPAVVELLHVLVMFGESCLDLPLHNKYRRRLSAPPHPKIPGLQGSPHC